MIHEMSYIWGAIGTSLQNRFKEFRRDCKAVKTDTYENIKTPAKIKQPKESPSIAWMQPPPVPMGEDKCSFDCFSSQLRDEAKRKKPRNEVISKLMESHTPPTEDKTSWNLQLPFQSCLKSTHFWVMRMRYICLTSAFFSM